MKFTILLLVVLVSTTFAVPMALRKGKGPGRRPQSKGSAQSGEGGNGSGSLDSMDDGEKIREGIKACMKAIRCETEEAAPEGEGVIGARRRQLKREEEALDCEEFAKEIEEELKDEGAKRSEDVDDAVYDEIFEGIDKCMEALKGCGQKVEEDKPVERFLKRMTQAENEAGCEKAFEAIEGLMEGEEAGGSQPNEEEPASTTEAPPARRALLKQLLKELYSKK